MAVSGRGSRGIVRFDVRRRRFSAVLEPPRHAFAKQGFASRGSPASMSREDTVQIASNPCKGMGGVRRRQSEVGSLTRNGSYRP